MLRDIKFIGDPDTDKPKEICGFCSSPDVAWVYDAISANAFRTGGTTVASTGWAACETCSALIEAGDCEELTRHSLATYFMTYSFPIPDEVVQEMFELLKSAHDLFFLCKYGDRTAV